MAGGVSRRKFFPYVSDEQKEGRPMADVRLLVDKAKATLEINYRNMYG